MKLSDLTDIDRETLYLRGASGGFKPENDKEAETVRQALSAGALPKLDWWTIVDFPPAVAAREAWEQANQPLHDSDNEHMTASGL